MNNPSPTHQLVRVADNPKFPSLVLEVVKQLQEGLLFRVEEGSKGLGLTQPVLLEQGDLFIFGAASDLHWCVEVPEVSSAGIGDSSPVQQQAAGHLEVSTSRRKILLASASHTKVYRHLNSAVRL